MVIKPNKPFWFLILCLLVSSSCEFKSKEVLYMERGLDILSNKKKVDFVLIDGIEVAEIGVIRDKKEQKKVLVFKMASHLEANQLEGYQMALRARIKGDDDQVRIERWDFEPEVIEINSQKYVRTDIPLKENRINKLSIYLYLKDDKRKKRQGEVLIVYKILTYND